MDNNSIKIDTELFDLANIDIKTNLCSTTGDKVKYNALANPDLPVDVVRDLLIAKEEQSEPFSLED